MDHNTAGLLRDLDGLPVIQEEVSLGCTTPIQCHQQRERVFPALGSRQPWVLHRDHRATTDMDLRDGHKQKARE